VASGQRRPSKLSSSPFSTKAAENANDGKAVPFAVFVPNRETKIVKY
jgi:hypothetical protein